jgi:hypothetical protein
MLCRLGTTIASVQSIMREKLGGYERELDKLLIEQPFTNHLLIIRKQFDCGDRRAACAALRIPYDNRDGKIVAEMIFFEDVDMICFISVDRVLCDNEELVAEWALDKIRK